MNNRAKIQEEARFRILRLLHENPELTQRELGEQVGISLGAVNYCLRALIERGLVKSGRMVKMRLKIPDVAGSLARVANLVAQARSNIVEIKHERTFSDAALNETDVEIVLETRGFDHAQEVKDLLEASGYGVAIR